MKTLLLAKDLLVPPETRQSSVTQSQKESWLRLMERERSSQFSSVASGERSYWKSLDSVSSAGGAAEQANRSAGPDIPVSVLSAKDGSKAAASLRNREFHVNPEGYAHYLDSGEPTLLSGMYRALDGGAEVSSPHSVEVAAGLPFLERMLRQRWPRANVLIAKEHDGVQIWIRDPGLLKNREVLDDLVAQIKKELASEGVSLNSLTVNGETVFCIPKG